MINFCITDIALAIVINLHDDMGGGLFPLWNKS